MIAAYVPRAGLIERIEIAAHQALPPDAIWFDLYDPTPDEKSRVQVALGIALPTREEMREIEPSARFYVEGEASYMTATTIARADDPNPTADAVTFILSRSALVTLRYVDPRPFGSYAAKICRAQVAAMSREEVLVGLVEALVNRVADILEKVGLDLDAVSRQIFDAARRKENDLQAVLRMLGRNDDLVSTTRESLLSFNRLVRFLATSLEAGTKKETKEHRARLKIVMRDIASLAEHAAFESHKVNFLLDATLGMINIEQNRIIKLFSVAAVVFLPPTLIASIYGMNFRHMPELDWLAGYPMALALMVLAAVLPYLYFKRKGWF